MFAKMSWPYSLRRLALLALAIVLISLSLTPQLTACGCENGSFKTVYTGIVCCGDPRLPSRDGEQYYCQSCTWVLIGTGCYSASFCAM